MPGRPTLSRLKYAKMEWYTYETLYSMLRDDTHKGAVREGGVVGEARGVVGKAGSVGGCKRAGRRACFDA